MKLKRIAFFLCIELLFCPFFKMFGREPGNNYDGAYSPSKPVKHHNKSGFVIEKLEFSQVDGNCIELNNCKNVVIRFNKFSSSGKSSINLYKCENVVIENNTFEDVQSGLVASYSKGIRFEFNDVTNVVGKLKGSKEVGVMAQFIHVSGAGNSISFNVCENLPGKSSPEDIISVFSSSGTAGSPIVVKGNWIRGGGPSDSGGGILLGDYGGAYQIAEDNILVDPGQYGIGIAGGKNMTLKNNKIFAKKQYFTNVGISICNWTEAKHGKSSNITAEGNTINYTNKEGQLNSAWVAGNMEPIIGRSTNAYDPDLSASVLPEVIIGRARLKKP